MTTTLDDHDPLILLSDQIFELLRGHDSATAIGAMGTCLALVLESCVDDSPEAARIMEGLKMLVGEVVYRRLSAGIPVRES